MTGGEMQGSGLSEGTGDQEQVQKCMQEKTALSRAYSICRTPRLSRSPGLHLLSKNLERQPSRPSQPRHEWCPCWQRGRQQQPARKQDVSVQNNGARQRGRSLMIISRCTRMAACVCCAMRQCNYGQPMGALAKDARWQHGVRVRSALPAAAPQLSPQSRS